MSYKNLTRYYDHLSAKYFYGGIPVNVIENSEEISEDLLGCAYAVNWCYVYIEDVKYLALTLNAEEEFLFDRLYILDGTYNDELYNLLTETESIRLCDGEIDFERIMMRNFNFNLRIDQEKNLYIIESLFPVEGSYGENLGAFYDLDEVFRKLARSPENISSSDEAHWNYLCKQAEAENQN